MKPLISRIAMPGVEPPTCDSDTGAAMDNIIEALAVKAFEKEGSRAFECSMLSAAIHEAGHVIMETATGGIVTKCTISQHKGMMLPSGQWMMPWLGYTATKDKTLRGVNDESPVADDIIMACNKIAGLTAEMVFDPTCMEGSSLDEVAMCQIICAHAGQKLNIGGEIVYKRVCHGVAFILQRHTAQHKGITDALLRNKTLRSRHLQHLVRSVNDAAPYLLESVTKKAPT